MSKRKWYHYPNKWFARRDATELRISQCEAQEECSPDSIPMKDLLRERSEDRELVEEPSNMEVAIPECAQPMLEGRTDVGRSVPNRGFFASKYAFMLTFCVAFVLQGMFYTYLVSNLTTIERIFKIPSKTIGSVMSVTELGMIIGSLGLSYYGGHAHRPRLMGCGMLLVATGSFMLILPHFIEDRSDMSFMSTKQVNSKLCIPLAEELKVRNSTLSPNSTLRDDLDLLGPPDHEYGEPLHPHPEEEELDQRCQPEDDKTARTRMRGLVIFVTSLLGVGIGAAALNTLGIPYLDDNITSKESSLYFAITSGVRILGPMFGFYLGSFCIKLYHFPWENPGLKPSDPEWIGGWWLGFVFISCCLLVPSLAMFFFPATFLPENVLHKEALVQKPQSPSLKELPQTLRSLLHNDFLVLRMVSSVLHIIPIAGFYTFLPKYLEAQFHVATHVVSFIAGTAGMLVMGVGTLLSGICIRCYLPNAETIAAWTVIVSFLHSMGMMILIFIGCHRTYILGISDGMKHEVTINPVCDTNCPCDKQYMPVCGSDGLSYYSPCIAACHSQYYNETPGNNQPAMFADCDCIDGKGTATEGPCHVPCNTFMWYLLVFSLSVFIHSTTEVGSLMLTLRCVDSKDKTMVMGLISAAIGLFVIYGSIIDQSCLVWDNICNSIGACKLYNADLFRQVFHGNYRVLWSLTLMFPGTSAALMLVALSVDVIIWRKAKRIAL